MKNYFIINILIVITVNISYLTVADDQYVKLTAKEAEIELAKQQGKIESLEQREAHLQEQLLNKTSEVAKLEIKLVNANKHLMLIFVRCNIEELERRILEDVDFNVSNLTRQGKWSLILNCRKPAFLNSLFIQSFRHIIPKDIPTHIFLRTINELFGTISKTAVHDCNIAVQWTSDTIRGMFELNGLRPDFNRVRVVECILTALPSPPTTSTPPEDEEEIH